MCLYTEAMESFGAMLYQGRLYEGFVAMCFYTSGIFIVCLWKHLAPFCIKAAYFVRIVAMCFYAIGCAYYMIMVKVGAMLYQDSYFPGIVTKSFYTSSIFIVKNVETLILAP